MNKQEIHTENSSDHWENRLLEVFDALWDDLVDPRDAFADTDGGWWHPVGATGGVIAAQRGPINEQMLADLRAQCRGLAATNEFAINGHENRISYIVGPGHSYRAAVCKGMDESMDLAMQVQKLLDNFIHENRWQLRQQEIVRRLDRDGEAFLRFFVDRDGMTRIRFIEPDQVATPPALATDPSASFGIQTDRRRCGKRRSATTSTASSSTRTMCSIAVRTSTST